MDLNSIVGSSLKDTQLSKNASPPGLEPLNWGVARLVFRITVGKYRGKVLKVTRDQNTQQNYKEIENWKSVVDTPMEKYFCPLVLEACDRESYEYVVMERADAGVKPSDRTEMMDELKSSSVPARDLSQGNLGYYKGDVVLIDYPYGKF